LAARVALIANEDGWCPDVTHAVYRANFAEDHDIANPEVIGAIIEALGRAAKPILERAGSAPIKDRLRAQTEEAIALGIFGAPSFTIGGELFWGNDRLEQAIDWARKAVSA
jgi:2-hydroxychromene-2-carboxylate isomerase